MTELFSWISGDVDWMEDDTFLDHVSIGLSGCSLKLFIDFSESNKEFFLEELRRNPLMPIELIQNDNSYRFELGDTTYLFNSLNKFTKKTVGEILGL